MLPFRLWLYRLAQFGERFADEAPACCGTCRPCVAATATTVVSAALGSLRRSELRAGRAAAKTSARQ